VLGLQFGVLLAGAIITETIFSWPGLGRLTVDAINARDYPLVQGCILMIALTYIVPIVDRLYVSAARSTHQGRMKGSMFQVLCSTLLSDKRRTLPQLLKSMNRLGKIGLVIITIFFWRHSARRGSRPTIRRSSCRWDVTCRRGND
jgi:hypothetical protein